MRPGTPIATWSSPGTPDRPEPDGRRLPVVYRPQAAKRAETRAKRMQAIIAMLARGEKFH
jgi:hypothetical protein